jgi:peptidylprolyl isomerase
MKYKSKYFLTLFFASVVAFCKAFNSYPENDTGELKVAIVTTYGTIKIKLYNETPLHRDNFVKLVKEHYYDSLLFHRVIQNFMIQGGDPDSKKAPSGVLLGDGGPNYMIPAEFNSKLFHKKGVIAAARESDLENPSQASSGSQFYIVQGKVFTDSLLKIQAKRITKMKLFNKIINLPENKEYLTKYMVYNKTEKVDSVKYIYDIIDKKVQAELPSTPEYVFSPEQIKAYTTIGGTPHLDASYTVFGEVYEGLDVVERIGAEPVDKNARPLSDIRIKSVSIIP